MADLVAEKINFSRLAKNYTSLKLPPYQRVYSWNKDNWSKLFQTINSLIKKNKDDGNMIHFTGAIVLRENFNNKSGILEHDIIDGSQRIITFLVLLSVISKRMMERKQIVQNPNETVAITDIKKILFNSREELKIKINNKIEQNKLDFILRSNLNLKIDKIENFRTQIDELDKWFKKNLSGNKINLYSIYEQLVNNFVFVLIVVPKYTSESELFLSINNTSLKLNASDLLKNFFIGKFLNYEKLLEITSRWDEDIVKKVSNADNTKVSLLLPKFFFDIWKIQYGKRGKIEVNKIERNFIVRSSNLYEIYEYKFKNSPENEIENFINVSARYAFLYEKIKNCEDDLNVKWWKENWPNDMLVSVDDINKFLFHRLVPVVLSILYYFDKSKNKDIIAEKVNKLVVFFVRDIIVKTKDDLIGEMIFSFLSSIREGEREFLRYSEEILDAKINEEKFEEINNKLFSESLKKNHLNTFLLRNYYLIKTRNENSEGEKIFKDSNILSYEFDRIISRNHETNNESYHDINLDSIGNFTLSRKKAIDVANFSNKNWEEKKVIIESSGNNCLINALEDEKKFISKDKLSSLDIKERKKRIFEEIKKFGIFR